MKLREHADKLGAHFKEDTVLKIEDQGPKEAKRVIGMNETYEARTLILATGAAHKNWGSQGKQNWQELVFLTALPVMVHFSETGPLL